MARPKMQEHLHTRRERSGYSIRTEAYIHNYSAHEGADDRTGQSRAAVAAEKRQRWSDTT